MCHGLAIFRFRLTRSHPTDGVMSSIMATPPQSNNELSVVTVSLEEQGIQGLTVGPNMFPAKMPRSLSEGSMDYVIFPYMQSPAISWL